MLSPRLQILKEMLQRLVRREATAHLHKVIDKTHSADLAVTFRFLDRRARRKIFDLLSTVERKSEVLSEIEVSIASEILEDMKKESIVEILEEMSPDDAADIVGHFPEELSQEVLAMMKDREQQKVEELLEYKDDTAGGIMSTEYFALDRETTAKQAIEALQKAEDVEMAFYVYIVNEHGHLVGVISLRQLVTVPPETMLNDIMMTDVYRVRTETDQEEVARIVSRYNFLAVPVVDESNKLLGIVTVDDVIDVIREEATEDMMRMAGASEDSLEATTVYQGTRSRFPWLLATCFGGIIAYFVIIQFEHTLKAFVGLAAFIPIVAGLSGNVGTQTSAIIIRGLAMGQVDIKHIGKRLSREIGIGVALGFMYGVILGGVASLTSMPVVGLIVGLSVCAGMIISALLGTVLPIFFQRINVDPAVATGPFITTSVDIIGVLIFFSIASLFISHLGPG